MKYHFDNNWAYWRTRDPPRPSVDFSFSQNDFVTALAKQQGCATEFAGSVRWTYRLDPLGTGQIHLIFFCPTCLNQGGHLLGGEGGWSGEESEAGTHQPDQLALPGGGGGEGAGSARGAAGGAADRAAVGGCWPTSARRHHRRGGGGCSGGLMQNGDLWNGAEERILPCPYFSIVLLGSMDSNPLESWLLLIPSMYHPPNNFSLSP